jgi:hypothetical protein
LSLGYEIAFATNGMSDLVQGAHDNRVRTIFPRVGRPDTAANIIAALPSIEYKRAGSNAIERRGVL